MGEKQEKDVTLELVKLVDKEYKESAYYFLLSTEYGIPLILLFSVWVLLATYFISMKNSALSVPTILTLIISFFALFFAVSRQLDENRTAILIRRNYYFILRDYATKTIFGKLKIWFYLSNQAKIPKVRENPLLKAIITTKAKNPQLTLEELYKSQKPLFREEKLIESLLYD
jgi:hypothetical protein